MAKQKQKVSAKQIEAELEKKATLDEKKEFLENAIKSAGGRVKEKLEKLLDGINNAIEEEKNLEERAKFLEQRLATSTEEAETPEEKKPEVTYARPRERAPMQEPSALEREVIADRPAIEEKVSFGGTAHKELFTRDISYSQHHIAGEKVLNTLIHYLRKEGLDPTRFGTSSAEQQFLVQRVTDYFGGSVPTYTVQNYLTSLQQSGLPGKQEPNQKYKLKLPDAREGM